MIKKTMSTAAPAEGHKQVTREFLSIDMGLSVEYAFGKTKNGNDVLRLTIINKRAFLDLPTQLSRTGSEAQEKMVRALINDANIRSEFPDLDFASAKLVDKNPQKEKGLGVQREIKKFSLVFQKTDRSQPRRVGQTEIIDADDQK